MGLTAAEIQKRVREILDTGDAGKRELLKDIQEGLLTAMYLEREAGENPDPDVSGKKAAADARQSRKQFKELAELVMEVVIEEKER